jgi:nucleoside 2-deoxyribosyltransferase
MRQPPLVYVAGPYTGRSTHDASGYHAIDRHIGIAREACAWLINHGLYFFSPHLNSAHFEVITPSVPPATWYDLDQRILEACDVMLVVEGWRESSGTLKEIAFCKDRGIPVYFMEEKEDREAILKLRKGTDQ